MRNKYVTIITSITILACFLGLFYQEIRDPQTGSWSSIIPLILVIVLSFTTQNVLLSLVISVIISGFFITVPPDPMSLGLWGQGLWKSITIPYYQITDMINFQILAFIILIMAFINVIAVGGGLKAMVQKLSVWAKDRTSTQFMTAILGLIMFIDDYANTVFVGSSMRPLSDHYRISREKLAFIVDATAAPVAGLAVISTWIGYEIGLFKGISEQLDLGLNGYSMFLDALSFRYYCIFMLFFVFLNIFSKKDYGPMRHAEKRALLTGQVARGHNMTHRYERSHIDKTCHLKVALIPFMIMFFVLFFGLWIDGGGLNLDTSLAWLSFTQWREVLINSENNVTVLLLSSIIGLGSASIMTIIFSRLPLKKLALAILIGAKHALFPCSVLILAWSIKTICQELYTANFLISVLANYLDPTWFPFLLFITAALTAFCTGTSWGTMAILIPVAIPIAFQLDGSTYSLVTIICLSAILDGAIFGDHCSIISDTTVLSSIATECDHIDHVKTQMPYSIMVAIVAAFFGYLSAAAGVSTFINIIIGMVALTILHLVLCKLGDTKSDN